MPAMSQSSPCLWTRLPQSKRSPRDRYKHACCSVDGHVYVLGGRDSSSLRDFWRYSVVCNEWTELNCTSEAAPEELEEHSMVAHEGFLYVFGGMLDSAYTQLRCPLWVFDIAKQKWVHVQGKASCPQAQVPTNRKGHSAVVVGSDMLLYGGFIDMKGSSQDFWSLNFDNMAWSMLNASQQGSLGPGPRHSHSAMAYQSCMYLFGGLQGLREQRDFWRWNSISHTWSSLKNKSGPSRLMGHCAVTYKDSMLLFGGGESQNAPDNCMWRYSFTTQTWTQVTTIPGSNQAPEKIHHCCTGLGPSYTSNNNSLSPSSSPGQQPRRLLLDGKKRPFKNRCFPAPLTFLGSEGAIELETFSGDKCYASTRLTEADNDKEGLVGKEAQRIENCLTFENKAFRQQWSLTEEEMDHGEIAQHLPDLLLVLGGRPCTKPCPISIWQMTLTD